MYQCKICKKKSAVKHGYRYNLRGKIQKYICKNCGAVFSAYGKITYRMRHRRNKILGAIEMRKEGKSLAQIAKEMKVSRQSILGWINKFKGNQNIEVISYFPQRTKYGQQINRKWKIKIPRTFKTDNYMKSSPKKVISSVAYVKDY